MTSLRRILKMYISLILSLANQDKWTASTTLIAISCISSGRGGFLFCRDPTVVTSYISVKLRIFCIFMLSFASLLSGWVGNCALMINNNSKFCLMKLWET